MNGSWFRPKSFGYGAVPVSWAGWALTLGSASIIAAAVVTGMLTARWHGPAAMPVVVLCAIIGVMAIAITIAVARRKTDGAWRWRP